MTDARQEDRERLAATPTAGEVCPVCKTGMYPEHEDTVRREDGHRVVFMHEDCAEKLEWGRA